MHLIEEKNPRPMLLEFKTFRMRGHEEASGTKYVRKELFRWRLEKKDSYSQYELTYLKKTVLPKPILKNFKAENSDWKLIANYRLASCGEEVSSTTEAWVKRCDISLLALKEILPTSKTKNIGLLDDTSSEGLKQFHGKLR